MWLILKRSCNTFLHLLLELLPPRGGFNHLDPSSPLLSVTSIFVLQSEKLCILLYHVSPHSFFCRPRLQHPLTSHANAARVITNQNQKLSGQLTHLFPIHLLTEWTKIVVHICALMRHQSSATKILHGPCDSLKKRFIDSQIHICHTWRRLQPRDITNWRENYKLFQAIVNI